MGVLDEAITDDGADGYKDSANLGDGLDMSEFQNFRQVMKIVGQGAFGSVKRVKRKSDGVTYMCKEVPYGGDEMKARACRKQLVLEVHILRALTQHADHETLCTYYGCQVDAEKQIVYLVMEDCTGGDLAAMIKSWQSIGRCPPEKMIWKLAAQLTLALHLCHCGLEGQPVLHRDVKPNNILFDSNKNARLADFGLSYVYGTPPLFPQTNPIGTPYYMPPEQITDRKSYPASDIWSLGCVLHEAATLRRPFDTNKGIEELNVKILKGVPDKSLPPVYCQELKDIIESMMQVRHEDRPSTMDLMAIDALKEHLNAQDLTEAERLSQRQRTTTERIEAQAKAEKEAKAREEREVAAALLATEEEKARMKVEKEVRHQAAEKSLVEEAAKRKMLLDAKQAAQEQDEERQRQNREREAACLREGSSANYGRRSRSRSRGRSRGRSKTPGHSSTVHHWSPMVDDHDDAEPIPLLNGLLLAQNMPLDKVLALLRKVEATTRRIQAESGNEFTLNFGPEGFFLG